MNFEGNPPVIEIKDDQVDDCSHRITELLCCRNCEGNAPICEKCNHKRDHQSRGQSHREFSIEQFNNNFYKLEEGCREETLHYVRQINETQKMAIENIRKKKEESLRELQVFKTKLMKNTYSILRDKFTNLYQKWKNQRFDTLKCNEVYWVMTASITPIAIKHSLINKQCETILKSFQNYKDITKNIIGKAIITNKQKAKENKISAKDFQFVVLNKEPAPIRLNPVDFSEQKRIKYIDRLNKQIIGKKQERGHLNQQLQNLRKELQTNQRIKWHQRSRLDLHSNVFSNAIGLDLRVQQIFRSLKKGKVQEQDNHLQVNQNKEIISNINNNNKKEAIASSQKYQRQENEIEQANGGQLMRNQQNQINSNTNIKEQQKSKLTNIIPRQITQNQINQPDSPMEEQEGNEKENEDHINNQNEIQYEKQLENSNVNNNKETEVKVQYVYQPYQVWTTQYLLQQMRKNGKDQQHCLKVENIQRQYSFEMKRLASPPKMSSKKCKKSGKFKQSLVKTPPTLFNQLANQLFEKASNKKNEVDKDMEMQNK